MHTATLRNQTKKSTKDIEISNVLMNSMSAVPIQPVEDMMTTNLTKCPLPPNSSPANDASESNTQAMKLHSSPKNNTLFGVLVHVPQ